MKKKKISKIGAVLLSAAMALTSFPLTPINAMASEGTGTDIIQDASGQYIQETESDGSVHWTGNEWNVSEQEMAQVENLKLGREDARSSFFPFADEEKALASQQAGRDRDLTDAYFQSLNTADGQTWKFYYVSYPGARSLRPDNEHIMNPDYDDSAWDEITVPKNWEASYNEDGTFKYNPPQYSNTDYAWITQNPNPTAPHAPTQFNPVGFYRTKLAVDPDFQGRSVFLNFEGVESAFYLWVNGHQVGFSEDSFTGKEFKIDQFLNYDGKDTLAVEVFKWSSGSWFEDQDMLTLAGIFRDVYLTSKDQVEIRDFTINTTKAGDGIDLDTDYRDFDFELYANIRDLGASDAQKNGLKVSVSLYDQEGRLVPDNVLENKELEQTLNASDFTAVDSKGRPSHTVKLSARFKNPLKWSAEHPNLYKALITLRGADNQLLETTAYRFGFRMIEIRNLNQPNAQMILNGQPLLIKGVNVHENNYETGRAMTYELIKKDVTMMKENNFNGIRMSHYSHDFRYYDLADELGMYVCDESNLETHGNRSIPSSNNNYLPAALDRVSSMFYRSKNFPSVIIHSLANEAGSGTVFGEMNKWLKGTYTGSPNFYIDQTLKGDLQARPIHYEGDNGNADIQSNMYPSVEETLRNAQVNKPYVLCEYSHAMGTSGGYYQDYWDAFESRENIQGGWIWDWVDQSVLTYVEPDAFPSQPSLGWQGGTFTSQDSSQASLKPVGGPDCLSSGGAGGTSGDYALNGAAYMEVTPDALNINSSFTIDVWVNPADTGAGSRTIIAKGDNQYKLQTVNGQIQFNTYCNGWNELNYVYDAKNWASQWHHLAAVYDAETKTAALYMDDMSQPKMTQEFSKANEDGTFSKSSQSFGVGRDSQNAGGRDWKGLIDNVRVYGEALDAESLSAEHNPADANVLYWENFDSGLTSGEVDLTNNVYTLKSQDALETSTSLVNRSTALTEAGVSGDESDKALKGPAVAKNTPSELDMNGAFTLEAWVFPTGESGQRVVMGKGDTQYVLRTQNGQLCLQLYSEAGDKWNQLLYTYDSSWLGNWHHVAATYDPETQTAQLFVDDMSKPAADTVFTNVYEDGTFGRNGEEFAVGRETTNTGRDWQGLIDNARVYSRVLSPEELQNEARTAQDEGVAFWQDFNGEPTCSLPVVQEGYLGFGGDWGDSPNSSNFCANGIVSSNRTPHGAMLDIKRVHQDYVMDLNGSTSTTANLKIRSRALFTNADEYDFVWELKENETTIRDGRMALDLAPLQTKNVTLSFDKVTPQDGKEYYLTAKFVLKTDTSWAKAGHEISGAQSEIDFQTKPVASDDLSEVSKLSYQETDAGYTITGQDFSIIFDRTVGTLKSFLYKGTELLAQDGLNGPAPNFWRAPTDGDRLSNIATTWRCAGQDRTEVTTSIESIYSRALKIQVSGKLAPGSGSASYSMIFTIYGDGQILVDNTVIPEGFTDRDLVPVIGNEMQLSPQFENLTWFGRGSDQEGLYSESYPDRFAQQFVGLYEEQVENQFIPYIRNQTFGNKADVRWAALTDDQGLGLLVSSVGSYLNINAQHYTQEELTSFGSKHPYESNKTDNIVLNLDYKNMAVGYDPGWLSKGWYDNDDINRPNQTFTYQYKLSPIAGFTAEKASAASTQSYSLDPFTIPVTKVTLNKKTTVLDVGQKEAFSVTVLPEDATNTKMSWTSSAPEIVEIDQSGNATAKKTGTATVTVTAQDGGLTDTCQITVENSASFVAGKITALPAEIRLTDEPAVNEAKELYDSLSDAKKSQISNELKNKLKAALTRISELKTDAENVNNKIASLPASISLSNEAAVTDAKAAYDKLEDGQKALVSQANKEKLQVAVSKIAELKKAAQTVNTAIEALPAVLHLTDEAAVTAAKNAYDKLDASQKTLISQENKNKLQTAIDKIVELKKGAEDVNNKIAALPDTVKLSDESAVAEVKVLYDSLDDAQKALVSQVNKDKLQAAVARIAALETEVEAVNQKIAKLPETIQLSDENAVAAAKKAYDSLDGTQSVFVSQANLDKLNAAIARISALKAQQEQEAKDRAAAEAAANAIRAIGTVTLGSKSAIETAEKAYLALTPDQKKLVTNYSVLTAAREAYDKLANQKPEPQLPKKGTTFRDGKFWFQITKADKTKGTVTLVKPESKKLKTVTIPSKAVINGFKFKVTAIAKNAFYKNPALTKVSTGRYVTAIGAQAFSGCKKLTSVTLGKEVTAIGKKAFYNSKKLRSVKINSARLKKVNSQAFKGIYKKAVVKMPKKKMKTYKRLLKIGGAPKTVKVK